MYFYTELNEYITSIYSLNGTARDVIIAFLADPTEKKISRKTIERWPDLDGQELWRWSVPTTVGKEIEDAMAEFMFNALPPERV